MCLMEWWSKRLAFLGFLATVSGFFSCIFGRNGRELREAGGAGPCLRALESVYILMF